MLKSRASPPSALGGADIHVMIDGEWADKGRCKGWLALGTKLHGELGTKLEQKLMSGDGKSGLVAMEMLVLEKKVLEEEDCGHGS